MPENIESPFAFTFTPSEVQVGDAKTREEIAVLFDGLGEKIPVSSLGEKVYLVRMGAADSMRLANSVPALVAEVAWLRETLMASIFDKQTSESTAADPAPEPPTSA